ATCEAFHIKLPTKVVVTIGTESVQEPVQSNMELIFADAPGRPHFTEYFSNAIGEEVLPLTVTYNEVIAGSRDAGPCTIQIKLSWQDVAMNKAVSFEPGDQLGILPQNGDDMVLKLIQRLDPVPSLEQTYRLMTPNEISTIAGPNKEFVRYLPPATVFDWFKKFLDITTPPTMMLLSELATYATNQTEKERLNRLSEDPGKYLHWRRSRWPTILSLLEEFSSLSIPAVVLIYKLPLMQPCFYSISSCLLSSPTCVDLTVGVVNITDDGSSPVIFPDGSSRSGLCSMYLNQATIGATVNAFFREKPQFHLPEDPTVPIIMVGQDIGIAPFRSFWMHRAELMRGGQHLGTAIFYGGYRTQEMNLYREEKLQYQNIGAIELPTTYCREAVQGCAPDRVLVNYPTNEVVFCYDQGLVQMVISDNAFRMYESLYLQNGHIYICGDFHLVRYVRRILRLIFEEYGNLNEYEVKLALQDLE
ncbi:hypothetical protein QYM36_013728, partial [Artemia franciscana]